MIWSKHDVTDPTGKNGYSRLSIVLHWFAAIIVVALFVTHEGERGSAAYVFHVSGGAIAGLILLWRVGYRMSRGMTDGPDQVFVLNAVRLIVLWGFLAAIVVVVISGYLLPWSLGRPLDLFGVIAIPSPMGSSPAFHKIMEEVHEIAGQVFPPLLALHVLAAAKHALINRDGVLGRMFKPFAGGR